MTVPKTMQPVSAALVRSLAGIEYEVDAAGELVAQPAVQEERAKSFFERIARVVSPWGSKSGDDSKSSGSDQARKPHELARRAVPKTSVEAEPADPADVHRLRHIKQHLREDGVYYTDGMVFRNDEELDHLAPLLAAEVEKTDGQGEVFLFAGNGKTRDVSDQREAFIEQLEEQRLPPVRIEEIDASMGKGLVAEEAIAAGSLMGIYAGELRTTKKGQGPSDYEFSYVGPSIFSAPKAPDWRYAYIDAERVGNHTRYINHSYEPNIEPGGIYFREAWHVIFVANRDIEAGEQLTIDYGEGFWKGRKIEPKNLSRPQP